jgi:hypothetical protein
MPCLSRRQAVSWLPTMLCTRRSSICWSTGLGRIPIAPASMRCCATSSTACAVTNTVGIRQRFVPPSQLGHIRPLTSCTAVTINRLLNGVKQLLVAKRFREEVHRAALQGLHRHWNITMSGDENDLSVDPCWPARAGDRGRSVPGVARRGQDSSVRQAACFLGILAVS